MSFVCTYVRNLYVIIVSFIYVIMSNLYVIMSWRWSNLIVTDWKPAVQSVDPWSEWITVICSDEGLTLEMSAFQLNLLMTVSFSQQCCTTSLK